MITDPAARLATRFLRSNVAMVEDQRNSPYARAVVPLFVVFQLFLLSSAWLCDDAFITLRTIDNFVHGDGLRYNVGERVQAYTHPLWLGVLSVFYYFTLEPYLTTILVSMSCTLLATYILTFKVPQSPLHALFAIGIMSLSSSFVDYSTSGLENPLTHLLLAVFFLLAMRESPTRRGVFLLSSVASLGILNRLDTVFLFLPPLLLVSVQAHRRRSLAPMALGAAPLVLWEIFSLLYYGFPFPNTAYAKLGAGIPRLELVEQGIYYMVDSLARDPVTLALVLAVSAMIVAANQDRTRLALVCSVFLYMTYTVAVGGDFMSGRFLSPVFFLAALLFASMPVSFSSLLPVVVYCGVLAVLGRLADVPQVNGTGITDEKAFYSSLTSLARQHRNAPLRSPTPERGETPSVKPRGAIGIGGYLDGPRVHTIDFLGLADPLLARLPSHDRHWWRIGHFERKLPEGYWATLETGRNEIADPKLAVYYDYLSIVTRGEVLSIERIKTIARFNLGAYDSLIDTEFYTRPYSKTITLDDLEKKRKRDGFPWDHESNVRLAPRNGVLVDLREERHCDAILLGLAGATRYRITYYRSGSPLASYRSTAGSAAEFFHLTPFIRRSGLQKHLIEVPEDIADGGYDAFMIYPLDASNSREHSIGYIDLCPDRIPR